VKRLLPPLARAALVSTLAACGGGGGANNPTTSASNIPNPFVWCVDTTYPPAESLVHGKAAGYDIDSKGGVDRFIALADGHIGLDRDRSTTVADDVRNGALGPVLAGSVVDDDGRPLIRQMLRDRSTDALGRAGYDGDFVFESHGVMVGR